MRCMRLLGRQMISCGVNEQKLAARSIHNPEKIVGFEGVCV